MDGRDDTATTRSRRHRRRWVAIGLVAAKLAVVAAIVLVPSGLAVSLGAAHAVAMVFLLVAGAVAVLVTRRRGRSVRGLLHRLGGRHLALAGRRSPREEGHQ